MSRSFGPRDARNSASSVGVGGMPPPRTVEELQSNLRRYGRPLAAFRKGGRVRGCTGMAIRVGYSYLLEANPGVLPADFRPDLTPQEMLMLGVFEGKYLNDCVGEFPAEWFLGALMTGRLSPEGPDPTRCNLFGVKSRQPLSAWRENGWAPSRGFRGDDNYGGVLADPAQNPDERGWFQWYCRFWMGRRLPDLDAIQIKRWRAFRRHAGAIRANCRRGDLGCRPRERQALLQWAYNPFI
jgi:hypothetical protein